MFKVVYKTLQHFFKVVFIYDDISEMYNFERDNQLTLF